MDPRYYQIFRDATQEDFYNAINDPEDELYDIVWDLFETLVIEPAEIFDSEFRDTNQFRYSIDGGVLLEFFPDSEYFKKRIDPNPYKDDSDPAGIHLVLSMRPDTSCLFAVGFQVWGARERSALKKLWQSHRKPLSDLFRRVKPMVSTRYENSALHHTTNLDDLLDHYFRSRDPEKFLSLRYSFAQTDEADIAQNFMVAMALLYHTVKDYCRNREDHLEDWYRRMRDFYSGHLPELPAPLPCVELTIASDAG